MPSLRKDFGNHLRTIRHQRKLSQERFAEHVGISVDFLSLIERGVNAPSFETIEQSAKKLRVPVKALFDFPERRAGK
jgi:transcriptional regulator with XRE-family HTH domain